jgi:DNA-directed RNA polymerase subunit RPC12/RpoP
MRKKFECAQCGAIYTIIYNEEELIEEPELCSFCGQDVTLESAYIKGDDELLIGEKWNEE